MQYAAVVKGGLHANYSGFLNSIDATGGTSIIDSSTRRVAQALDNKGGYVLRELIDTLLGVAPGQVAQAMYPEIAPAEDMGGVRAINNTSLINRATTALDVTQIKQAITVLDSLTHTVNQATNYDRNPLGTR